MQGTMSDPFHQAETATMAEPSQTTFAAPSASALLGANSEWAQTGCHMTVEVPIDGSATISSKAINRALATSVGSKSGDEVVVMPTGFQIIGAHCCNPTGSAVGLKISGAVEPHLHIGSKAGDEGEHFSAVISSRFHPVGDFKVARKSAETDQEDLAARVEIAQKWAGVKPDDLLVGVKKMVSKDSSGQEVVSYAVPLVVARGDVETDPVTGEKSVEYVQQPLAWCMERNAAGLEGQMTISSMPDMGGNSVDHMICGEKTMQEVIGATHQAVWGAQDLNDVTISAKSLGAVTGDKTITVGIRVDADVLSLSM